MWSQPNKRATFVAAGSPQICKVDLVSYFPSQITGISNPCISCYIIALISLGQRELSRREDEATPKSSSLLDYTHTLWDPTATVPLHSQDSGYSLLCMDVQVKWQPWLGEAMGCSPDKSDPSIAVYHYVPLAFLDLWLSFHSTCGSVSMHTVLFDTSQLALGTPVVQTILIAWVECQWCGVQQNTRLPMFSKFLLAKVFLKLVLGVCCCFLV